MTDIEWTRDPVTGRKGKTWNIARGCTKISPGCKHCYAETFAERFRGVPGHAYERGFDLRLVPERLPLPFEWKPCCIFVNSMSDLFHVGIPAEFIGRAFDVMASADWHTYQVLTKRAERMAEVLAHAPVLPHVWIGVSVEDRRFGLPRIDALRSTPAAVRFLSVEPLLEDLGEVDLTAIDWVIVGGESGVGARPLKPEWVRSLRDQCQAAKVPFFFKQWGGLRKKIAGRQLDGREWNEMPPIVRASYPGRAVAAQLRESIAS